MAAISDQKLRLPVQQLVILSICRFAEPVALTSVFPYLPEMIESFNVPENDVAKWAGITSAVFSFSQCLTGLAWGRASDYFGRKYTILAGLTCTMITCLLFGFSQGLAWAIVARSLAGASSGTVGIIRTTVAELVPERELQPKAFSIMPLVWSVGAIVGPILGGALANPAKHIPNIFGGIRFFEAFPFALPNLVASAFFVVGLSFGFLFLKETLEHRKNERDYGRILGQALVGCSRPRSPKSNRRKEYDTSRSIRSNASIKRSSVSPPSYREVFSYQSNLNLFVYTILALHSIAYDQLISVFLHTTLDEDSKYDASSPLKFAGGFGLPTARIGLLFTLYGIAAMFLQFLVFPPVAKKYGILNCLKAVTLLYPFIYIVTPFATLLPTDAARQVTIFSVMLFKCLAGVFSFPCTTILLTNSAGSLRLLGTLNGVATSISAAGRGIGPFTTGNLFTWGMKIGYGVIPWWFLAFFAVLGHIPTWWLIETDGFGSKDADEESSDGDDGDEEDPTMEIPLFESHLSDVPTDSHESENLLQRSATFESIAEEPESDNDDDDANPHKPLLAGTHVYSQVNSASKNSASASNQYARRGSNRSHNESVATEDKEDDQTSTPLGMGQIIRKGRRLSSNLGLSEGLGRTEAGSGFGTRGPDLGMGYDRSRSRSVGKRRSTSRSQSRSKTTNISSSGSASAMRD